MNDKTTPDAAAGDHAAACSDDTPSTDEQLKARVAELERELQEANDAVLRARAELDNFRKRTERTVQEERKYYPLPFVRDLVSVLDDLHRAIEMAKQSDAGKPFAEGLKMVSDRFEEVLRTHHCLPIEAHGKPFDPNVHEAIGEHPTEELPEGTVSHVARIGFTLHDRVVRPAQVLVSRRPSGAPAEEKTSESTESTDPTDS